jgi:hypothetical protein
VDSSSTNPSYRGGDVRLGGERLSQSAMRMSLKIWHEVSDEVKDERAWTS